MKTRTDARALAESIVATGNNNGVRTEALITAMDVPLGYMVGNALEVREAIQVLRGEGSGDLEMLSVALTSRMVQLGGLATSNAEAETKVRAALASGRGLEVFRKMIAEQGGDPRVVDDLTRLPAAPRQTTVQAERSGFVADIHAEKVGVATMLLGAGRNRVEDRIDPAVGARLLVKPGDWVQIGDALLEVHYRAEERLAEAMTLLRSAWRIEERKPDVRPLVLESLP
jgi:thymidine phosphorylase